MLFSLLKIKFTKKKHKTMIKKSIEVLKALFFLGRNKNENENNSKKGVKSTVNEISESSEEDCSYHYWLNLSY